MAQGQANLRDKVEESYELSQLTNRDLKAQVELTRRLDTGMAGLEDKLTSSSRKLNSFLETVMSKIDFITKA